MDLNKSNVQLRKGDPIAQMNNAENKNHIANQSNANQFLGYKLNTRIRALRTSKGWSQAELGERLAETMGLKARIPISTIASWEHKNPAVAKIPTHDKIEALSRVLRCSPGFLMGWEDSANPASDNEEKSLLDTYRKLNHDGKRKLLERADELLELGYIEKGDAAKMA